MEKAFGFSLAPLVVRASELALKANQVSEETRKFRRAKEALSICRRGVRKLIMAAMEEGLIGDWVRMEAIFITIVSRIPRNTTRLDLERICCKNFGGAKRG